MHDTNQRRGDWMQTASGGMYWPLDPKPSEVHLLDIAHALSHLCRYNGHCDRFYSVAEHSVHVSRQVPHEHALCALLHDATEAYVADVPRPLKRWLQGYREIEDLNWVAVAQRFGLPLEMPDCVKVADNAVLLAEKAQIMKPSPMAWGVPGGIADVWIRCWSPGTAQDAFVARYVEITHGAEQ